MKYRRQREKKKKKGERGIWGQNSQVKENEVRVRMEETKKTAKPTEAFK